MITILLYFIIILLIIFFFYLIYKFKIFSNINDNNSSEKMFSGFLVILTAITAVISLRTTDVMQSQIRPYITIDNIDRFPVDDKTIKIVYTIKNFGNAPAEITSIYISRQGGLIEPIQEFFGSNIAPGQELAFTQTLFYDTVDTFFEVEIDYQTEIKKYKPLKLKLKYSSANTTISTLLSK